MVLMESYFFCASVRLGVLAICVAAGLKSVILMWLIFTDGIAFMYSMIHIFESYYRSSTIVNDSITWVEKYPRELMMFLQLYNFCHIVSCIIAAFGAYKLKRYHVIPLAIFEFFYTVQVVIIAVIALRIARHIVPLATLILLTLGLTAYAMLVAYDTLALIAFVQIMCLVRSKRYQRIYGSDPLHPVFKRVDQMKGTKTSLSAQNPIIIYVMPKPGHKLWKSPPEQHKSKKVSISEVLPHYFLRDELVSKVLLRNSLSDDYRYTKKTTF
ncbi:hypothetical protein KR018_004613 [Drosophila ironensis]|nr:hypothetical protein KR018_004613 [Drosophila ironensis]